MTKIRDDRCPLCAMIGSVQIALDLSSKPPFSDSIVFRWCADCDLIYAECLDAALYRQYYETTQHDSGHVDDTGLPGSLHNIQARLVGEHLGRDFHGNCLDFGCGAGQLSELLMRSLPKSHFYGVDLRNSLRPSSPVEFLSDFASNGIRFDLIILSHVAEHMVDLSDISSLTKRLVPGGSIYVEVPDPLTYGDHPRREFMYYFDRLHVNHFSQTALTRLLAGCNLKVTRRGSHKFRYRDGDYPAQFVFASEKNATEAPIKSVSTLAQAFDVYHQSELERAKELRESIITAAAGRDLLVYGHGDNFFRARSQGGPLYQMPIKCVLDRNAGNLQPSGQFETLPPAAGLRKYPDAVVLVAISGGAADVVAALRRESPGRTIIMV